MLLERWDRLRNVPKRSTLSPSDKMQFLVQLAFWLHKKRRREFSIDDAERVWSQECDRFRLDVPMADFIEELVSVDNAIQPESGGLFSLGHLSFQEYLTAIALVNSQAIDFLASKFEEEWWRNVIIFFAGITGDATNLLGEVHSQTVFSMKDKPFMERIIAEARHTPRILKNLILEMTSAVEETDLLDLGREEELN